MKKLIIFSILIFTSCSHAYKAKKVRNDHKKEKPQNVINKTIDKVSFKKNEKRLRYLFFANGGLIGYFDDGTIVGCPRCDLMDENINEMYSMKSIRKYEVRADGSLLVDKREIEYPRKQNEEGISEWAMIDYNWIVQPKKLENLNHN